MSSGRSLLTVLALLVLLSLLIGGCAPITPPLADNALPASVEIPHKDPVVLSFWDWFGGAWVENYENEARLFSEQYPWITVEVTHFPDQSAYREALSMAFGAGHAPDVFARRHPVDTMIQNGWIQPINPWLTSEWMDQFPEGSFINGRNVWNGQIYSFPNYAAKFDRMLYINEDLFRAAGLVNDQGDIMVPSTWNDVRRMASEITHAGQGEFYGIGIGLKDTRQMSWWFDLAGLAGAPGAIEFDYRTGRYVFGEHPAYGRIVELLLGLKQDGSVFPSEGSLDDSNLYIYFGQGKVAMMLSGSWTSANLAKEFPSFDSFRIVPLPVPDEGRSGGLAVSPGQTGMYYMSDQTQHPDEAWLWMDWMASRGFGERMVTQGLDFSVFTDLNSAVVLGDPRRAAAYDAATRYLVYAPYPPSFNPDVLSVVPEPVAPDVGEVLIGIYTGQISDWKKALADLDSRKLAALESAISAAQAKGAAVSINDYIFPDWNPLESYDTVSN